MLVYGTNSGETLNASDDADEIWGYGGKDTIFAYGGDDNIEGGEGADYIHGGNGIDAARYDGSAAGVYVSLATGTGIGGDAQGDRLVSIENLVGSAFNDILSGNGGINTLAGGRGNDQLKGFGGNDTLWGSEGDDHLMGGEGADTMRGGDDNDTYYVDNWADVVIEDAGNGFDTIRTEIAFTLPNGLSIEVLRTIDDNGTAAIDLLGNTGNNQIIGNNGDNVINGGAGADQMSGRGGNDTYTVDNVSDTVAESGGAGNDVVRTSVSWTLTEGADVETLRTTDDNGTGLINLFGNSSGNEIIGNNGDNMIGGGAGDDYLTGLGGVDHFLFNTALDADNVDEITDFSVTDDTIILDNDVFTAFQGYGPLAAEAFRVGTAAQDADDRIIYNSDTGALFYDSDGTGGAAAIQFAMLDTSLGLSHLDFYIHL